jgi:hypothetical protein
VQDGGIRASRANQAQGHAGVRESRVLLNDTGFFFSTQTRILCIMYNTVFVFVMYFVCIMCCWTLRRTKPPPQSCYQTSPCEHFFAKFRGIRQKMPQKFHRLCRIRRPHEIHVEVRVWWPSCSKAT